jgi:hypothetical protein
MDTGDKIAGVTGADVKLRSGWTGDRSPALPALT